VAAALLTGCAATPPAAPVPEPEPAEQTPDPALVTELLNTAAAALEQGQVDYPYRNSALDLYTRTLDLDPDNAEARRGLESIAEDYLAAALDAADARRFASAQSLLDRARLADPEHPGIAPAAEQLKLLQGARRSALEIGARALAARSSRLAAQLRDFGAQARATDCLVAIRARNDGDGRWIYAQLSAGPGEHRIRARMDIGSPAKVEVLCFG
jgi:tetratricopeptide (TPR) repeat protein